MSTINRGDFLGYTLKAGALVLLSPLSNDFSAYAGGLNPPDDALLKRLVAANDKQVAKALPVVNSGKLAADRQVGYYFALLSASYSSPGSDYHHSAQIIASLETLAALLIKFQNPDGTLNFENLESPPDTAFLLDPLTAAMTFLLKDASAELNGLKTDMKAFLQKAGNALTTGGIHTPNHRWVVCSMLSRLNVLYPDKKYIDRINDWLGEGIFMDKDGHYPERSINYALVENNSMFIMGRLLNKPSLFEPVRKNLELTYYYMDPDGLITATDSRRQDQYKLRRNMVGYYLFYRYFAIRDKNDHFAGIARLIEQMKGFEEEIINRSLFHFLECPLLLQEMQEGVPPPVDYEKLFTTSHLLRIRRDKTVTTLFGGVDWPLIITSGRSDNPNIYSYRKGSALLKYMRVSSNFFNTGYFYSDGLRKENNQYILYKQLKVPYYQPLPKNLRRKDGDYKLSPSVDGRFWNKMDYSERPVSNVKTLETTVSLTESKDKNELTIEVTGQAGVPVTIELCFLEGGKLSGVEQADNGNSFLVSGMGEYEFGGDSIRFGPGAVTHRAITGLEGERYSTHFGSLRTEGMYVYLTGTTPFTHKLSFG